MLFVQLCMMTMRIHGDGIWFLLGKIRKVAFLTVLETPGVANLVYRIDFCRKSADGKNLNHQQLFQLVFGKVDGKSQLLGMRIM